MLWILAVGAVVIIGVVLVVFSRGDKVTPVAGATTSTTDPATTSPGDLSPTLVTTTTSSSATGAPVFNTTEPPPSLPPPVDSEEYQAFRQQPTACNAETPPLARAYQPPEPPAIMATPPTIVLETSCGNIVVDLNLDGAPQAAKSFTYLGQLGFFDGTVAHRIVPGVMVQLGDPTATGVGGPGYRLVDELPPADFVYTRGVVAMANTGPDTSGSQFFIVTGDASHLPPEFTVLGHVIDGFDVLDLIDRIPVTAIPSRPDDDASYPVETLYIERLVIPGL
jgi:cyclophilin family peptidyl-prolyl cis-trans isomerase